MQPKRVVVTTGSGCGITAAAITVMRQVIAVNGGLC
jgi:hypothetical protein